MVQKTDKHEATTANNIKRRPTSHGKGPCCSHWDHRPQLGTAREMSLLVRERERERDVKEKGLDLMSVGALMHDIPLISLASNETIATRFRLSLVEGVWKRLAHEVDYLTN